MRLPAGSSPHMEREAMRHMARALGWPFVDLRRYAVSCGILRKLPAELSCRLRVVPLVFNTRRVVLAVDEPMNALYLQANQQLLGPPYRHNLEFALASRDGLDAALHRRLTVVRG